MNRFALLCFSKRDTYAPSQASRPIRIDTTSSDVVNYRKISARLSRRGKFPRQGIRDEFVGHSSDSSTGRSRRAAVCRHIHLPRQRYRTVSDLWSCDQSGLGSIARGHHAANGSAVSGDVLLSPTKVRGVRGDHHCSTRQEPQRSGSIVTALTRIIRRFDCR